MQTRTITVTLTLITLAGLAFGCGDEEQGTAEAGEACRGPTGSQSDPLCLDAYECIYLTVSDPDTNADNQTTWCSMRCEGAQSCQALFTDGCCIEVPVSSGTITNYCAASAVCAQIPTSRGGTRN